MSDNDPKVVDLNQRRRTVSQRHLKQDHYKNKNTSRKQSGPSGGSLRWYHYLQFFLVLAIISYGTTLCQR